MKRISLLVGGILILGAGVALAVILGLDAESGEPPPPPGPLVEVARAEPVDAPPAIRETGFVRSGGTVTVTSEVSGRVREVSEDFALGRIVEDGAMLVALETDRLETELARARAERASAEAEQDRAQNALQRQSELEQSEFATEAALDEAEANEAAAEAQVALAEAAIADAERALEDATVAAPFRALVMGEEVAVGQFIQPGTEMGQLVRADYAEVRTGLTATQFADLRREGDLVGRSVTVQQGETTREGRIAEVASSVDAAARTVELVVRVPDPFEGDVPLLLNDVVDTVIPLPERDRQVLALPARALQPGQRIWRVTDDEVLAPVSFTLERRTDDTIYIASDTLDGTERILLTAVPTPVEGLEVRVEGDEPADDGGAAE